MVSVLPKPTATIVKLDQARIQRQPPPRVRWPKDWGELRARILTRMSDRQHGTNMYTITRRDSGQEIKLLAFDGFDALVKFHGKLASRSFTCDQVDGKLRATHKHSGIEYVITAMESYFAAGDG